MSPSFFESGLTLRMLARSCVLSLLALAAMATCAQAPSFANADAALAALFPARKPSIWNEAQGDFNGDGIQDLALVLTLFHDDRPFETRVLVLAGMAGGRYYRLSMSGEYCPAQKFLEVNGKGSSLFLGAVHKADGDGYVRDTLQFRFNAALSDFELVGGENVWESYADKTYGRISDNYLAGKTIEYERVRGHIRQKSESHLEVASLARLDGFECDLFRNGKRP